MHGPFRGVCNFEDSLRSATRQIELLERLKCVLTRYYDQDL